MDAYRSPLHRFQANAIWLAPGGVFLAAACASLAIWMITRTMILDARAMDPPGMVTAPLEGRPAIGYPEGGFKVTMQTLQERFHPEDSARVEVAFAGAMADPGSLFDVEFRLRKREGGYLPILGCTMRWS